MPIIVAVIMWVVWKLLKDIEEYDQQVTCSTARGRLPLVVSKGSNTMNTEANSMTVSNEEEGSLAAAYEEYLDSSGVIDGPEVKEAYYAGAQAVLLCANPLSKIGRLTEEIEEFFDGQ